MRRIAIKFSEKVEAGHWLVELELAKPDQLTLEQKASLFQFKREVVHVAKEILEAWFNTPIDEGVAQSEWNRLQIERSRQLEKRSRTGA